MPPGDIHESRPGAVTSMDSEVVQVGDAFGQRAQGRGLSQGAVRPVGVVDVPPGSALEAAYGASNLEPLPPGDPAKADKSAISN
jgi:hypothetical protein